MRIKRYDRAFGWHDRHRSYIRKSEHASAFARTAFHEFVLLCAARTIAPAITRGTFLKAHGRKNIIDSAAESTVIHEIRTKLYGAENSLKRFCL